MRSFRKAAIAAATVTALTLGTTSVAAAQETEDPTDGTTTSSSSSTNNNDAADGDDVSDVDTPGEGDIEIMEGSSIPANGSSRLNDNLNGDQEADGRAIFGSSKVNEETGATFDGQPAWAKLLYGLSITGAIGALVGLVVGPIHNFFVHGPGAL